MKAARYLILSALFAFGCGGSADDPSLATGQAAQTADSAAATQLPASADPATSGWTPLREEPGIGPDTRPQGKGGGIATRWAKSGGGGGKPSSSNGINYHGGPLILGTTQVYFIWYGSFGSTTQSLLTHLAQNLGGSSYFNINTTYYDGNNTHVSNSVRYVSSTSDNYSRGKSLSDSDIQAIVAAHYPNPDPGAVYFVLTAKDVKETSGFCSQYCGWHTHGSVNGVDTKYAFIGDPEQCPSACAWQDPGPNGDLAGDGMASIVSHELEEAVTDPDLNAWFDHRGYENADKCAWTFGTTSGSNGAEYNVTLGGTSYLIQRNWVNASGGYCSMSYP